MNDVAWLEPFFRDNYIVQNASELAWLVGHVRRVAPKVILEVGVEAGGTLRVWEALLPPTKESLLIGIDMNPAVRWDVAGSPASVHVVRGNSHDPTTLERVRAVLAGRAIDFLFIDGEHTDAGAKADLDLYGSLVRTGGIIGFHDVNDVKGVLDTLPPDKLQRRWLPPQPFGMPREVGTGVFLK